MTAPAPHPILEAIDVIDDVSILADELIEACGTLDLALMVLGRIEDGIHTLQIVRSLVDAHVIELRGPERSPVPVPGGGIYKVSGGATRDVYDNDRLAGAITRAIARRVFDVSAIVRTDGTTEDPAARIESAVSKILALVGATAPSFAYWRAGAARELGIDLAAYRTRTQTDLRGRIESRMPR